MKGIFKITGCALLLLLLNSCRLTTFSAQPGSPRNSFPVEMQGTFRAIDKNKGSNDTTVLKISESKIESNDKILNKLLHLSDTTTLTHLGDYYFFNIRHTENDRNIWWTFPVLVKKDALYIFSLSQGKQEKKMGKYLKLTGNAAGEYQMDNEPFKNYCEKHLKKRKAIKLKRIN